MPNRRDFLRNAAGAPRPALVPPQDRGLAAVRQLDAAARLLPPERRGKS